MPNWITDIERRHERLGRLKGLREAFDLIDNDDQTSPGVLIRKRIEEVESQ